MSAYGLIHISEMFQIKTALNSMNILCVVWVWDSQSGDYEEFWDPRIRWKSFDISETLIVSIFTVDK
jgi:hypothetical protein